MHPHAITHAIEAFRIWKSMQIERGNNNLKPVKVEAAIRLMHEGEGCRQICRAIKAHTVTAKRLQRSYFAFLSECPEFQKPKCKCGRKLWHRGECVFRDAYMPSARDKGHATQARNARKRYADIFFQTIEHTKTMSNTLTIEPNAGILRFAQLVQRGIDAWTEAGKLLVEMIDADPTARDRIIDECPDLTAEILARFEAIGRNQLHPKTLLNNSPGMRRLRQLPFSEQQKFLSEPVPVLIRGDKGPETLNIQVQNLTTQQAMQAFSAHSFRPLEAQRAWVESRRPQRMSKPYTIKGHKVVFNQGCEMTAQEISELLGKML